MHFIFLGSSGFIVFCRAGSLLLVTPEGLLFTNSAVVNTQSMTLSAAVPGSLWSLAFASLTRSIPFKNSCDKKRV